MPPGAAHNNKLGGTDSVRWVFYSLVVVNLVYLGWQLVADTVVPRPPVHGERQVASAGGATLHLLSEDPQPARRDKPAPVHKRGLCPVVGPWSGRGEADRARVQLDAAGLQASVQPVTVQKDHLNWVYLPPYPTRKKALAVLHDLQAHGVDSFIVKSGQYANAISLGYFTSDDSAKGLQLRMRDAGYPAFITQTSRPVTEYWLYMPDQAAGSPALKDFLAGNPDVKQDMAGCPPSAGAGSSN